ncbi:MAG: Uridine nucleosidase 1 [Cirrosporium novae-zelandiae]|nr:MAG: Uridine nucleosidase 1 [Cirrosporium novae-zelandiae]
MTFSSIDENEKIPLWLDCDPGISTVHGNASLDHTTINARRVLAALNRSDIEVYPGTAKPFCRPPAFAPDIHGSSGLDTPIPLPEAPPPSLNQPNFLLAMRSAILAQPANTVWVVATGSLTNVALLFASFPEIVTHIRGLSVMGGAIGNEFTTANLGIVEGEDPNEGRRCGNRTRWAEFNIFVDPESAASIFSNHVLASKTVLAPLDLTHLVLATESVQSLMLYGSSSPTATSPSPLRQIFHGILTFFSKAYSDTFSLHSPPLHDPISVAVLLDSYSNPDYQIAFDDNNGERWEVTVDTSPFPPGRQEGPEAKTGMTLVKKLPAGEKGVRIPRGLDTEKFWKVVNECLSVAETKKD